MTDPEQEAIDAALNEMLSDLHGFIFTQAHDWKRSLRVSERKRDLLIDAIDEFIRIRDENKAIAEGKPEPMPILRLRIG